LVDSLFSLLNRWMVTALLALAFLVLPASSEPLCDGHTDHACVAVEAVQPSDGILQDTGPAPHEHELHSHGLCHASMVAPESLTWIAFFGDAAAFWPVSANDAPTRRGSPLERPPRI
jgi:hypothetical protein